MDSVGSHKRIPVVVVMLVAVKGTFGISCSSSAALSLTWGGCKNIGLSKGRIKQKLQYSPEMFLFLVPASHSASLESKLGICLRSERWQVRLTSVGESSPRPTTIRF